jgi:hypothetical protein
MLGDCSPKKKNARRLMNHVTKVKVDAEDNQGCLSLLNQSSQVDVYGFGAAAAPNTIAKL